MGQVHRYLNVRLSDSVRTSPIGVHDDQRRRRATPLRWIPPDLPTGTSSADDQRRAASPGRKPFTHTAQATLALNDAISPRRTYTLRLHFPDLVRRRQGDDSDVDQRARCLNVEFRTLRTSAGARHPAPQAPTPRRWITPTGQRHHSADDQPRTSPTGQPCSHSSGDSSPTYMPPRIQQPAHNLREDCPLPLPTQIISWCGVTSSMGRRSTPASGRGWPVEWSGCLDMV